MEPVVGSTLDAHGMLAVALEQARIGFAEGGVPVGGAIFHVNGTLLGAGHNRLVQEGNGSLHGETDAFRAAGAVRPGMTRSWSPRSPRAGTAAA